MIFTKKEKTASLDSKIIEKLALEFLIQNKIGYTRQMYNQLNIRNKGLSLNKFRNILETLERQKRIIFIPNNSLNLYSSWKINE